MQSEQMMQTLKDHGAINKDTAILCMMNGLGHDERLSQFVPKSQIFLSRNNVDSWIMWSRSIAIRR